MKSIEELEDAQAEATRRAAKRSIIDELVSSWA
jgi:hypothetical protein